MSHPAGVRGLKLGVGARDRRTVESHPAGVRGLKPKVQPDAEQEPGVAPRRGAWIETERIESETQRAASHPAGVRGLKLCQGAKTLQLLQSHPAGVRGLKQDHSGIRIIPYGVAPRRGAWIETHCQS